MKKILPILLACLIPLAATAQITVKGKMSYKTVKSIRMGYVKVTQADDRFYLVLKSTNDFEESLMVKLGTGAEQAAQTMDGIVQLFDAIDGGVTTFSTPDGKSHDVTRGSFGNMYFLVENTAGQYIMGKGEAKQCAAAIAKVKQ